MPESFDDILADARALGKKIAAHPRTKDFLAAARAVAEDREAQNDLKAYQDAVTRIRTLEAQGKPIEPEDKRKAADAERQVAANEKLKAMMKFQADYLELMHRINTAIEESSQAS
jgi:cell fate (sporulation/competence/biofilm development) regulator YlbF (YheA/YmcA/DUF963 family)